MRTPLRQGRFCKFLQVSALETITTLYRVNQQIFVGTSFENLNPDQKWDGMAILGPSCRRQFLYKRFVVEE